MLLLVLCAVLQLAWCVVLEPVLCVVLEPVLCVVLEPVLCVVLEPRARFASPARFARFARSASPNSGYAWVRDARKYVLPTLLWLVASESGSEMVGP